MSESTRRAQLSDAGHNPLRLSATSVPFDFLTDVPHRVLVPQTHRTTEATPDEVCEALAPLTGAARLAIGTKGRAAEHALVEALELSGPPLVLTHGLFTTTAQALAKRGAVLEDLKMEGDGSSNVDIAYLEERLARGGVHLVYLEVANNAWFGWPLAEANLAAARAACDRHGAKLLLDAARPLANGGDAARMLAHAHAFTISCAKEFLVPIGSIVGSPDAALITRVWQSLFKAGTSQSAFDPAGPRADLRDGVRYVLSHRELIAERLALARQIGNALREANIPIVEPVTAHAVFIPIDKALVTGEVPSLISLLYHLYAIAGIRAQLATTKRGPCLRLAIPLCTRLSATEIGDVATGFAAFLARIAERPALQAVAEQVDVPYFRRFALHS